VTEPKQRGHLNSGEILDYLEGRHAKVAGRRLEEHLAAPCAACQKRLEEIGLLVEHMQQDRVPEVPAALRAAALDVFVPASTPAAAGLMEWLAAKLVFDSRTQELATARRKGISEAHRLSFTLGEGTLELECEVESAGTVALRGRLLLEQAALHRIRIEVGEEHMSLWPDGNGQFGLDRLPAGTIHISVSGPAGRWRVAPFEV